MFSCRPVSPDIALQDVRRVGVDEMTEADVEHLFGGETPLIITGVDRDWPAEYRTDRIRDVCRFRKPPNSVIVDGKQSFNVGPDAFIDSVEANKNVRVFGGFVDKRIEAALRSPRFLFDRLDAMDLYRLGNAWPACFIGAGGAITPLHYDFEENINWHIVLAGERLVHLWTAEQSGRLFKLPLVGLSIVPFSRGLLGHRLARGYRMQLKKGDFLYMPPACWHQIEYPTASMAATFGFHLTPKEQEHGYRVGHFWNGFMSYFLAVGRMKPLAIALLPVMAPYAALFWLYMPANFMVSYLPGAVRRQGTRAIRRVEKLFLRGYLPFMRFAQRRFWVGY